MLNPVMRAVKILYGFYFVIESGNQTSKTVLSNEIEVFVVFKSRKFCLELLFIKKSILN